MSRLAMLAIIPLAACVTTADADPALICTNDGPDTVSVDFPADRDIAVLSMEIDGEVSTVGLMQQPTASGFRYLIPATELTGQGDEATLVMQGVTFQCAPPA